MTVKIQVTEDAYRLVIDGTPTESAGFGESIEVDVGGHMVMALADVPEDGGDSIESKLDQWVYVDGKAVEFDENTDIEDVDSFDDEEDEGDGDGEETPA